MEGAGLNLSLFFLSVCRLFRREICRCRILTDHKFSQLLSAVGVLEKECRLVLKSCRLSTKPLGRPVPSASCLARKMYIENHGAIVVLSKIQPIQKGTVVWGNNIPDYCSACLRAMTFFRFEPWNSQWYIISTRSWWNTLLATDWLDCGMHSPAVLW